MTAPKTAFFSDGTPIPVFWERLVLACYMRMLGATQKQAGAAVGRSERSIRVWEADPALWARASAVAKTRWMGEITALARRQLLKAMMSADGELSLKLLERLDESLAPPAHRLKHEGAVALTSQPEWLALRTAILEALADWPEARLRLAAVLSPQEEPAYGHNGTGH